MARYKDYSYDQQKLLPVRYSEQILPGTFEYTLGYVIDHELDLSVFDGRYRNDEGGAPAYDPRILLKIILFAYSRGVVSSRRIENLCRENVVMMALSADTQPHWTTVSEFISSSHEEVVMLFREVLTYCDALGLIGKELFAIDGLKLPSNAAKEWSGKRADLKKKQRKLEQTVRTMLVAHRARDAAETDAPPRERAEESIERLRANVRRIKEFLATHDENRGPKGTIRQSNVTDPESAKMKTSHGVIQGYTAVAAVDGKHQVIMHAQAHGEGQEHGLLVPTVEGLRENLNALGEPADVLTKATLTADAGYASEANMRYVFDAGIDAYIADTQFRKRDPRFKEADRYKVRAREDHGTPRLFRPADFTYDETERTCTCPAGKRLYKNGANVTIGGLVGMKFTAPLSACLSCGLRDQCLKHPEKTRVRQVVFFNGRSATAPETFTHKMKRKIDSLTGKRIYQRRLATVEPVFANIRAAKGLDRFTLRGKTKVNSQWLLYCLVHNLGKIQRYGPALAVSG
ncbi:MAG: IS1182 family transposase [Pseudomonadota bacterium]